MRSLLAALFFAGPLLADSKPTLGQLTLKPPDTAAKPARELLGETAVRVTVGDQRLTIWLRADWPVQPKTDATGYASLRPGALVGVVTFAKPWTDFRGQELAAGTYTLRYARQPASKDHEDTSPSSDFLMLCPAADDRDPADLPFPALKKLSGKASGGTHPAVMVLLPPGKEAGLSRPKESWLAAQWIWKTAKGEMTVNVVADGVWTGK